MDTVGRNEKTIKEYVRNQLQEDIATDQLSIREYPFTGEPVKSKANKMPPPAGGSQ